jgi:hypothetical protein
VARYVVGIDLGTSNSALAYADLDAIRASGRPEVHDLAIPQLVAPGDVQARPVLPSARYEAARFELPAAETELPWPTPEGAPVVGEGARRLGAKTPVRLVESAKSWLCHGGVNRTASILPWHAPDGIPKLSPVDASASYLAHLRAAWDTLVADGDHTKKLAAQDVIITVPASFDEVARRLTLEAAKRAGLGPVTLVEEPLAAFYAFVHRTGGTRATTGLAPGQRVLVADVGGGTSDFTLVDVTAPSEDDPSGRLGFTRSAVGDHLLLGGDNMDLALAYAVEAELARGKKLEPDAWAQLKLECRLAKEAMFTDRERASLPIVVQGRGSKLVGGALRAELTRATLEKIVVDGYFPELPAGAAARPRASDGRTGLAEFGLPYASDPAITRHVADFLLRHARPGEPTARVDAILYNGGALKPAEIRDRLSSVIGAWLRASGWPDAPDPRPLVYDAFHDALELAVARGAAVFGLVRAGLGQRVGGGSPRTYYLGLGADGAAVPEGHVQVLCVAPRGMQEGHELEVSNREFSLVTNRPVEFPLFTSTSPTDDAVGDVRVVDAAALVELPALRTVVKFGKQKAGTEIPVRIQARRTEVGTLELSCFSRMSGARFKLELDLRAEAPKRAARGGAGGGGASTAAGAASGAIAGAGARPAPEVGEVAPERLAAAKQRLVDTWKAEVPRLDPEPLMKGLEQDLGLPRDAFPLATIRALGEALLERLDHRGETPVHEARWLNAVGFLLRPGSGFPLDDWRVKQLWRVHAPGPVHAGREPVELQWWILWRRVAAGLSRGPQEELASILFPLLVPALEKRAKRKPPRPKSEEAAEMWRAAAALEQLSAKSRAQLGDALVDAIVERRAPQTAAWCLGRIGARKLLYGPRESIVRRETVEVWIDRWLATERLGKDEDPSDALLAMARLVGDRALDLDEKLRVRVGDVLAKRGVAPERTRCLYEVEAIDDASASRAFGEGLPAGLRLA